MNEQEARRIVRERSAGICELCRTGRATDFQHRKNRSQGGQWSPSNGIHLCHTCHMDIHKHPEIAMEKGWTVPSFMDPAQVPVWVWQWPGRGYYLLTEWGGLDIQELDSTDL